MSKRKCCAKDFDNLGDFDDLVIEGQLTVSDGTVTNPSIVSTDSDTGINFVGDQVNLVQNGSNALSVNATNVQISKDVDIAADLTITEGDITATNTITNGIWTNDATGNSSRLELMGGTSSWSRVSTTGGDASVFLDADTSNAYIRMRGSLVSGTSTSLIDMYSGAVNFWRMQHQNSTNDFLLVFNGTTRLRVNSVNMFFNSFKLNADQVLTNSTNYTLTNDDDIIRSTAAHTLTLPLAASFPGKIYTIMNTAAHTTTIQRSGSDTIDDGSTTSITITTAFEHVTLKSEGVSVWLIV